MKTKLLLFLILSFYFCLLSSQVPQGFNYQAIARDGSGNPITGQTIDVKLGILSDTTAPVIVREELFTSVKTNAFGMFTIVIGSGTFQTGSTANFTDINWIDKPLFLRTQVNYKGTWKAMGSSKLWSVPYSLIAKDLGGSLKKLKVTGNETSMDSALFEVKNRTGQTVFAVYNEGVRVYVDDGITKSSTKGGFAIGGFSTLKSPGQEFFRVTRDSTRIYINNALGKSTKGGFAIGGFDVVKGVNQNLLTVSDDSVRVYIDTKSGKGVTKGGFAIGGFGVVKASGEEYLRVTRDSTRIYINDQPGKGATKGGFAIGGFNALKGTKTPFTSLTPENYFIGHEAGISNTTGLYNSFFGYKAGRANTSGLYNIFIGHYSGTLNKDGWGNLFIGDSAGYQNTSGYANVSLGLWAGQENTTGRYNVSLGTNAGTYNNIGYQNIYIGMQAGYFNTSGTRNTIIGTVAGQNNNGGSYNVMLGNYSGYSATLGDGNVYLGSYAGRNNLTGNWNVFIGYAAGRDEMASQRLYIANSSTTSPLIYGEFDNGRVVINGNSINNYSGRTLFVNGPAGGNYPWFNDSDRKLKNNIVTIPDALQKVLKLRGVNFLWNQPAEGMTGLQMGFIGQEVIDIIPEVVSVNNDHYSMQYAPVTALLVEAIKDQQQQIENQQKEIDELKTLVSSLVANQTSKGNN